MNRIGFDLKQLVVALKSITSACIASEIIYINAVTFLGFPLGSVCGQARSLQTFADYLYNHFH